MEKFPFNTELPSSSLEVSFQFDTTDRMLADGSMYTDTEIRLMGAMYKNFHKDRIFRVSGACD